MTTPPRPRATRIDYTKVIPRLTERLGGEHGSVTAELVMTQVALEAEQAAHDATRAELEELRAERAAGDDDEVGGGGEAEPVGG